MTIYTPFLRKDPFRRVAWQQWQNLMQGKFYGGTKICLKKNNCERFHPSLLTVAKVEKPVM